MSSFTMGSRVYNSDEFLREGISLAQLLAKNARLEVPLPQDTDLSDAEHTEVQQQINAMCALPPFAVFDFWSTFAAYHLPKLSASILSLSYSTQRRALSTHIQILTLLPSPDTEPYFRRFIMSSISRGIATRVVDVFIKGIDWQKPSGPGHICTLIINLLFWGEPTQGADGKAPISSDLRDQLARKLDLFMATPQFSGSRPELQQVEIERLRRVLNAIETLEGDMFLRSTREHLEGTKVDHCAKDMCGEDPGLTCSKCKSVRYCGKECQRWHWKNGHKLRCHQALF